MPTDNLSSLGQACLTNIFIIRKRLNTLLNSRCALDIAPLSDYGDRPDKLLGFDIEFQCDLDLCPQLGADHTTAIFPPPPLENFSLQGSYNS